MRATTFKIGTAMINLGVLSYAVESVVAGGVLTGAISAISWTIYTGNDYFWDTYLPTPAKTAENQSFDASAQTWRASVKYFTYKPLAMTPKFAMLYLYTGSVATMATYGTAISVADAGWFFANDLAWSWYDWATDPGTPQTPKQEPVAVGSRSASYNVD
jgi:uncharacterized membrane protein